ncbi:MAG TPA: NHL repeat-containing protein [Thermoanaerobaculia bacterium]|nr:NHL repeat-containing protein [Thermoanaerobaculia bacterium]
MLTGRVSDVGWRALLLAFVTAAPPALGVKITEFTIPTASSEPRGIVAGPDGYLYFTEKAANKIGVMSTAGAFPNEFTVPYMPNTQPYAITRAGSFLFFTEYAEGKVSLMTPTGTFLSSYGYFSPLGIVYGEDGRLYVAEQANSKVGVTDPLFTTLAFEASTTTAAAVPWGIAFSPNLYVYVTEYGANKLAECPTFHTMTFTCAELGLTTGGSGPIGAAVAPDGRIWVTEYLGNNIARVTSAGFPQGFVDEYPIATPNAHPFGIALGPDGNMWFTEENAGKIGRITPTGTITEYPLPTGNSGPAGIALGPDGNLYVCESTGNKIAKVQVFLQGDVSGDGIVDVSDVFYLINFLFAGGPAPK